jgi:hypothetical protein
MILPYDANPCRMELSETTARHFVFLLLAGIGAPKQFRPLLITLITQKMFQGGI